MSKNSKINMCEFCNEEMKQKDETIINTLEHPESVILFGVSFHYNCMKPMIEQLIKIIKNVKRHG